MQRLIKSAPIESDTLAIYEETVAIIHRYLPPSLALLFATARQNAEGELEWWTARQGLAIAASDLKDAERATLDAKRQAYQETLAGLIEQLFLRGEAKPARALQNLLSESKSQKCYSVGGEPVLVNWSVPLSVTPVAAVTPPRQRSRGLLLALLLLLFFLLIALLIGWFLLHRAPHGDRATMPPAEQTAPPQPTQLTPDNPSTNLGKRKDFGRIKVNLTWRQDANKQPIDLDVAAFIRLKNGRNVAVEALSKYFGAYDTEPFMLLQQDLRDGRDNDGEWLFINGSQWQAIDEVLIYSFIYDGAQNWQGLDATITLSVANQPPVSTTLSPRDARNDVAAIARLKNVEGDIKIERLNDFFPDRETLAKRYGWRFKWTPGASKN
ncbi:tellurite resistance domain protein [Pantoea eucrina]|uniref:Tellurite resistance domain protein n=1 Tax=Pantoea eucrina TaxID=472693 RepID=A0ABU5LGT0_9GAMM|nr:tellurite resistance domain protein [Pantoea eucrina]MDZ7279148.1 tellurite resistance domain protein [Pantoea eucrina]